MINQFILHMQDYARHVASKFNDVNARIDSISTNEKVKVIDRKIDDSNSDYYYYGYEYENGLSSILRVSVSDYNSRSTFSIQQPLSYYWNNRLTLGYS